VLTYPDVREAVAWLCSTFGFEERLRIGDAHRSQLVELTPPRRVVWRCTDGPAEWLGTTQTFDVREADGESVVMFTHADWVAPVEFMHHCSTRWGYFLLSLKHQLEQAAGTPWPDDEKF